MMCQPLGVGPVPIYGEGHQKQHRSDGEDGLEVDLQLPRIHAEVCCMYAVGADRQREADHQRQ